MSILPQLLETYSNLILSVEDDENYDPLWLRFYQIQMASFILGSMDMDFSLKRAMTAYDRICSKWEELDSYLKSSCIPVCNYDNLFSSILIDFD